MTLLDAQQYDPGPARRRRIKILVAVFVLVVLAIVVWMNRYWSEERVVGKFFAALQNKDYETAYAIYFADPQWKKHPQKYSRYPLDQFTQDWGPGGQWGTINKYKVNGASGCSGGGSGIVVDVIVNDNTLSLPPCELLFR
jgi:hypothetical protein